MSKKKHHKCKKINVGLVVASVGVGVVITIVIPVWGWILAAGAALIGCGWYLLDHY